MKRKKIQQEKQRKGKENPWLQGWLGDMQQVSALENGKKMPSETGERVDSGNQRQGRRNGEIWFFIGSSWWRRQWHPTPVLLPGQSHHRGAWWAAVHGVTRSQTRLSDFTFTFHFHALEKEMATHSSVLAWRIPETGEPGGLPSMGLHRVGHDWSDSAGSSWSTRNSLWEHMQSGLRGSTVGSEMGFQLGMEKRIVE